MTEWEDDPDVVGIKYGLNANNHREGIFNEIVVQATPIFMDTSMIRDGGNIGMIFSPFIGNSRYFRSPPFSYCHI